MIPVIVITNNKHLWLLQGFMHQFNKYWGEDCTILGFSPPVFSLPSNFKFFSLSDNNGDILLWSTYLREYLTREVRSSHFILLLEDYWLVRSVNVAFLNNLIAYTIHSPEVLRMDLTLDRASIPHEIYGVSNYVKIIATESTSMYQMSLQAGIWNKKLFLSVVEDHWTPWQIEVDGSQKLANLDPLSYRVLGTLIGVLDYSPVFRIHKNLLDFRRFPKNDLEEIRSKGLVNVPPGIRVFE